MERIKSKEFVNNLSAQSHNFCIIGLTGKIKSGTADVCSLLSTIAWKHNLPLLESLSHRHLDRRLRSAEFLAVLFHAVCSDEFEHPA